MSTLVKATTKSLITVGASNANYVVDGTADNVQLQAAIDTVSASSGIKGIVLTSDLSISSAVNLKSNVMIDLGGRTLTLANSSNSKLFDSSNGLENVTLKNGTIDGNGANQVSGDYLVDFSGGSGELKEILLDNLYIKNSRKHMLFFHGDETGYHRKVIRNCTFDNHGIGSIGFGVYVDYAPNTVVDSCTFFNSNGNDVIEAAHLGHIFVSKCWFEDGDINYPFGDNCVFSDNIFLHGRIINDTNTANNVTISNNIILSSTPASGYGAIRVHGSNSRVIGNYVYTDQNDGIRVQNGDNHIVKGNTVVTDAITGTETGIHAGNSANKVIIEGNIISNFANATRVQWDDVSIYNNTAINCTDGVELAPSASTGHTILNTSIVGNNFEETTNGLVTNSQASYLGQVLGNIGIANSDFSVPDEAYGSAWNGSLEVPTKNAIYDKIETLPSATTTSGVYTPTRSAEANLDSNVTPSEAQYMRVGSTVTVSGNVTINPTLTTTATSWELTIPVASNIGAVEDLAGTFTCGQIAAMSGAVSGSVANNTAVFNLIATDVNSNVVYYQYSYQVI